MILRPFALIGFSFAAVLLALILAGDAVWIFAATAGCILLLCAFLRPLEKRGAYAAVMLCVLLACAFFTVYENYSYQPACNLAKSSAVVRAQLVSNPVCSNSHWSATLKVISVDGKEADCNMALYSDKEIEAQPYDILEFSAETVSIEEINPEIKNYYKSQKIFLVCYGFDNMRIEPCEKRPPGYYLLSVNSFLTKRLEAVLDGETASLAEGMLMGDKTGISAYTQKQFSKSGLSHVLAVSGLHMSILVMSLYKLLRVIFKGHRRIVAAVCILTAVLYAGVTGFSPSAIRSSIMLSVMFLGKITGRRADALNSMGLAALLIALSNPYSVADWSFMLSFSATLGIVLLNRYITSASKAISAKIRQPYISYPVFCLVSAAGISLAATVFCLPVMVFFVGSVSTVFIAANLLTLYAVPAVLVTALMCAVLPAAVTLPFAFVCNIFCTYILKVVGLLSSFKYAQINTDTLTVKYSLLAVSVVLLLAVLFLKSRKRLLKFSLAVIGAAVAVNVAFGLITGYKQVNIAVTQDSVVIYKDSTAAVFVLDYYGCYQADFLLDSHCIDEVYLILPYIKEDKSIFKIESIFENYRVERLLLNQDHDYKFCAENYEIAQSSSFEFGGMKIDYSGNHCVVNSPSGSTLVALSSDVPAAATDFLVSCDELPEWADTNDYIAVIGGKDSNNYSLLKYNGFGRYEIK